MHWLSKEEIINFLALVFFGYLFSIKRNYIGANIFLILWNLIGVVLHEFCHYIVALLLNGKPKFPSLIPRRQTFYQNGFKHTYWILGYVESRNINSFNAFFIGLAPVIILFPLAFFIYTHFFIWFELNPKNLFIFYFLEFLILYNALPSKKDIEVSLKGFYGFITLITLIFLTFLIWEKFKINGG